MGKLCKGHETGTSENDCAACILAREKDMVREWVREYMLTRDIDAENKLRAFAGLLN